MRWRITAASAWAEIDAELDHTRAIAEGLPEDVDTFAVPRDTRKLDDDELADVREAQRLRDESTPRS